MKKSTHPDLYTIFKPNVLIKAKKGELNLTEIRVYNEILNHNHKKYPDQRVYEIDYENIFDPTDKSNLKRNHERVSSNLMNRKFHFDQDFMEKHFGLSVNRYLTPFPTIDFDDKNKKFIVYLNEQFKTILTMVGKHLGENYPFTRGDIESLRQFDHEITHTFYWVIRKKQAFHKIWEPTIEELREELDLQDKYKDWRDLKKRVIDVAYSEMQDTWTQFEYVPIKGGRGASVKKVKFFFKNGPVNDSDKRPIGYGFPWESVLLNAGLDSDSVKRFRHLVNANSITIVEKEGVQKQIIWDSIYIETSIEVAREEYAARNKDKSRKKIDSISGWLFEGLEKGWWVEEVEKRKKTMVELVQQVLHFES